MGATDSLAPPPGFVDDVSPPDGFVADEPSPPAGFVPDETPAREPSYPVGPPSAMAMIGALSDATTAAALQGNLYDVFTPRNPAEIVAEQNKTALQNISEGLQEPSVSIPTPEVTGPLTGALRGAANLAEGLSAPMNALLVPFLGGAPGIIKGAAGVGFGVPMAKHAISETLPAALDARSSGEAVQNLVEGIGGLAMATGALGAGRPRKDGASKTAPPRSGSEDITTDTIKAAVDSSVEKILSEPVAKTAAETVIPPETPLPNVPRETLPKIETAAPVEPIIAPETKVTESPTGIRNAIVDQERVARGLPERMEPLKRTFGKLWDEAMAKADQDPQAGSKLVKSIEENPRPLEDWESALLAHEQVTRQNAFDKAVEAVNSAKDEATRSEASARLAEVRDEVQQIYDVGQTAGTKSGQSLAARKLLVDEDYSLAKMESETRAVVNEGKPLSAKQASEISVLHERISATESKLAEYEGRDAFKRLLQEQKKEATEAAKTVSKVVDFLEQQAEKARERIVARRGRLNVTVDPLNVAGLVDEAIIGASHIAKGVTTLAEWSARMVADFGQRIAPYLKELFAKSKELHDANAKAFKTDPLGAQKKAIVTRTEKLKSKIEAGDFAPTPKKQPVMDRERIRLQALYETAKQEYRAWVNKERAKRLPLLQKARGLLQEVRGVILGSDIGVLTRQGLFSWARPTTAIKATAEAVKSAFSPEAMKRWEVEVRDREINGEAVQPKRKAAGLQLTDTLNHPEELVVTRLLSRLPDIKVGGRTIKLSSIGRTLERFQTTFINAVRADLFDSAVKRGFSQEELKTRANFINSSTGRSNAKYIPRILSEIMTSPRYELSRWEMLAQPVRNLGVLAKQGIKEGKLDRAALSNLQDMAVAAASIYALYKLAEHAGGYHVTWNPMSSDFGKMRKGNEVWDVTAGMAPRLRDVIRLYVGATHPSYKRNIGDALLGASLRTINPAVRTPIEQGSVALQRASGVSKPVLPFSGFKSVEEREGLIALAPLIVQSVSQALEEEGPAAAVFTGAREFIGSSVQRYPEPKAR